MLCGNRRTRVCGLTFAHADTSFSVICDLPHNNTTGGGSAVDASLERLPGGSGGNATDTNINNNDFTHTNPSTPRNLSSPAAP